MYEVSFSLILYCTHCHDLTRFFFIVCEFEMKLKFVKTTTVDEEEDGGTREDAFHRTQNLVKVQLVPVQCMPW